MRFPVVMRSRFRERGDTRSKDGTYRLNMRIQIRGMTLVGILMLLGLGVFVRTVVAQGEEPDLVDPVVYFDPANDVDFTSTTAGEKIAAMGDLLTAVRSYAPHLPADTPPSEVCVVTGPVSGALDGYYIDEKWGIDADAWCWQDGSLNQSADLIKALGICVHELTHCQQPGIPDPEPLEPGETGGGDTVNSAYERLFELRYGLDEVEAYTKQYCAVIESVVSGPTLTPFDGGRAVTDISKLFNIWMKGVCAERDVMVTLLGSMSQSQAEEFSEQVGLLQAELLITDIKKASWLHVERVR